jgi:GT2 family glycosyltransferase
MPSPIVSLITVNYRQPAVTLALLESIRLIDFPTLEVIVVDNDPVDNVDFEAALPGLKLIRTDHNLGFAGANNVGMKAANGDYFLLVNNDTELNEGLIDQLLSSFVSKDIGAVSPVIRYFDEPDKVQFAGFTSIHPITGRNQTLKTQSSGLTETAYFHGAAVMVPAQVVRESGLMSEEYFLYYEEVDWSVRIRANGYRLMVCHNATILHKESVSTEKNSPLKTYYQTRNRVHFMRKNSNSFLLFLAFFLLISVPKIAISLKFAGSKPHIQAFKRAIQHSLFDTKYGKQDFLT